LFQDAHDAPNATRLPYSNRDSLTSSRSVGLADMPPHPTSRAVDHPAGTQLRSFLVVDKRGSERYELARPLDLWRITGVADVVASFSTSSLPTSVLAKGRSKGDVGSKALYVSSDLGELRRRSRAINDESRRPSAKGLVLKRFECIVGPRGNSADAASRLNRRVVAPGTVPLLLRISHTCTATWQNSRLARTGPPAAGSRTATPGP